jgi:hypothetical protein
VEIRFDSNRNDLDKVTKVGSGVDGVDLEGTRDGVESVEEKGEGKRVGVMNVSNKECDSRGGF